MAISDKKITNRPRHVAIIMDGNGRWAEKKGLDRVEGHREGAKSIRAVVETCYKLNIKNLTLYAFSTENWGRPKKEVDALMDLLCQYLDDELEEMMERKIRLRSIGMLDKLPKKVYKKLQDTIRITKDNTRMTVTLAVSYGGREEIVEATRRISRDVKNGKLSLKKINPDTFRQYLHDPDLPDPDLLIRTSGECRVSNFLLWQIAYTEVYFASTLWPDFRENELKRAILNYSNRERRFGILKLKVKSGK